jgi:hypothetical protein
LGCTTVSVGGFGFAPLLFPNWAKARAMQHWIDRSGIAHRPMPTPFNGPQLGVGL